MQERNSLLAEHMRYIYFMANRMSGRGVPIPDLVQEGVLGLFVAHEKWNPNKGTIFMAYAGKWIKYKMQEAIRKEHRYFYPGDQEAHLLCGVTLPDTSDTKLLLEKVRPHISSAILNDREQLIFDNKFNTGEDLTYRELADKLNISRQRVCQIEKQVISRIRSCLENDR